MSIYLDEKNPEKHKPFDDASPDIVAYVRYLEVIAGKSPNTAFSYYCDLRNFSRFMKRPYWVRPYYHFHLISGRIFHQSLSCPLHSPESFPHTFPITIRMPQTEYHFS